MFTPFSHERLRFVVIGAIVSLVSIAAAPGPAMAQAVPAATTVPNDPLLTLNDASRVFYTQAKATALEHHGPVIIVVGDDLVLRKGNARTQVRIIPDAYHTLKAIAHVPMAIDVALAAHDNKKPFHNTEEEFVAELLDMTSQLEQDRNRPNSVRAGKSSNPAALPDDFIQELRDYRALLPAAEARITAAWLDLEDQARQKAILGACGAFIDAVIARKQCAPDERTAFTRRMNPLVMANAAAAARAALDSIDHQVGEWRKQMKPEEWHRVTVLVIGRQLPRKDNLAIQYFGRLLGESGDGKRIIYAEGLGDEPRALDLLATHLVDKQIATDFFNDSERMNRDLLSDAARSYLPLLLDEHHWSNSPNRK
jgi:hypothetical protein